VETPRAILDIAAIAAAGAGTDARIAVFVVGTNDLARETGASLGDGRMALLPWLQSALIAARAHGIAILDGVYNDIADTAGFAAECRQGRALGMDGKTVIHPTQIGPANAAFGPDAEELAWARKVVAAFEAPENREKGALSLDGRMVERLHAEMARRALDLAASIVDRRRTR